MSKKESAGILVYRYRQQHPEFFLVHMGGPFWKNKEKGAWTIPKGEIPEEEDGLTTARREFREETGFDLPGPFTPLNPIKQAGGKIVNAWACQADLDPTAINSNVFSIEWPPKSGRKQSFPEVDRAAWMTKEEAEGRIISAQLKLLQQIPDKT